MILFYIVLTLCVGLMVGETFDRLVFNKTANTEILPTSFDPTKYMAEGWKEPELTLEKPYTDDCVVYYKKGGKVYNKFDKSVRFATIKI